MRKPIPPFSLLTVLVLLLIPSLSYPFNLTLTNTPIQVYFSPNGGCTEAIIHEIDRAKTEILVQAYSFTSLNGGSDPMLYNAISTNATAIPSPIPILWVVGTMDPTTRPSSYGFDKTPFHPKSKYLEVTAGHADTPRVAADQIILWIESLGD